MNDSVRDGGRGASGDTDAFVRLDRSGRILEADKFAPKFLGLEAEDLLGREVWDLIPDAMGRRLQNALVRVERDRIHSVIEAFDARLGSWVEYHLISIEAGILLLMRNLTAYERKGTGLREPASREQQLEAAIKEESDRKDRLKAVTDSLEMALSAARMATSEYDIKSGRLSFSKDIEGVLGVPAESAPSNVTEVRQWMPFEEDYRAYSAILEAAVETGNEYKAEFRVRNPKTGEIRWIENRGRAAMDEFGRAVRIYGIAKDITERKRAQEELQSRVEDRTKELSATARTLRESEARVGIALRNAPITISMVDRNLRYTWFYHPLLPDSEQYIGKPAEYFLPPGDAARVNAARRRVLDTGVGTREEIRLVIAGQECYYIMPMEPLKDEAGNIEGVTTLGLDITERKRTEVTLQALNRALERRAEQLRRLSIELTRAEERERRRFANMLHDNLQQILAGARFSVQSIINSPLDDTTHERLDGVVAVIDEAIAASRELTAEVAPPVLYQSGLPKALRWLAKWIEEKHGLAVDVAADERQKEVSLDTRVVLFQAVKELLFNVVKHAQAKRAEVVLCYGGEDAIAVSVRDEGVGFDPGRMAGGEGTVGGFGLMAIRERLSALGGTIDVLSAPGQGTTTTIRVPIQPVHPL